MKITRLYFFMPLLLFSCTTKIFDYQESFVRNHVTAIHEKYFSMEGGKKSLQLESVSFLSMDGQADSIQSSIHSDAGIEKTIRKMYYNPVSQLDSIVTVTRSPNSHFIHTEVYHYNLFFLLDSVRYFLSDKGERSLYGIFVKSSSSEYNEITTELECPSRKIKLEEFIRKDAGEKMNYTKSIYHSAENKLVNESYEYQYDNFGKLLSRKLKNNGTPSYIHIYNYYPNDLRKSMVIMNMEGDTVSLHEFTYEFAK